MQISRWRLTSKTEFVAPRSVLECTHLLRHYVEPPYTADIHDESDTKKGFRIRGPGQEEIIGRLESRESDSTHVLAYVYFNAWHILALPVIVLFGAMILIVAFGEIPPAIGLGILVLFMAFSIGFLLITRQRSLILVNVLCKTLLPSIPPTD